jgi:hypothetical protein
VHVVDSRNAFWEAAVEITHEECPEVSGQRRGPWLSGLIAALLGAVWLCVEVGGGVVQLVAGWLGGVGMS